MTAANGKAAQAWAGLNERQRLYLSAIYDADQEREQEIAGKRFDRMPVPPAAEWRQLRFSLKLPRELFGYTTIQDVLRAAGEHDSGAGATLAALERRGLVKVRRGLADLGIMVVECVYVTLTTPGRAAARAGRQETRPAKKPTGLLAEWLWESLAVLYRADDTGVLYGHHGSHLPRGHVERGPSWNALLRLRDHRDGPFMEEFQPGWNGPGIGPGHEWRARITSAGRRHYELHHACYRELYPETTVVDPAPLDGAHTALADHAPSRRPRHLVREPDWRVLAQLARLEAKDRCPHRDHLIAEYMSWNRMSSADQQVEVPERIRAMPVGLTAPAIKKTAKSTAALDRLQAYPGGALVALVDVPMYGYGYRPDHNRTLPLVCLTDAGRAHIAQHRDEYLRLYPEVTLLEATLKRKDTITP
ncbi:hypothetical protein ACQSSU_20570 [Micromonospora echinospora]